MKTELERVLSIPGLLELELRPRKFDKYIVTAGCGGQIEFVAPNTVFKAIASSLLNLVNMG